MATEATMTNNELKDAVQLLLKREEERDEIAKQQAIDAEERQRADAENATRKMAHSIEVIKWCVLSISSVMVISLIIGLIVLSQVKAEAERIKAEVEDIQREAEMIRDKIRHPMETVGGLLGKQADSKLGELLGGE